MSATANIASIVVNYHCGCCCDEWEETFTWARHIAEEPDCENCDDGGECDNCNPECDDCGVRNCEDDHDEDDDEDDDDDGGSVELTPQEWINGGTTQRYVAMAPDLKQQIQTRLLGGPSVPAPAVDAYAHLRPPA